MRKAQLLTRVYLTGLWGSYNVQTGGYGGLPDEIPVSDYLTGTALVRWLREQATENPHKLPRKEAVA